MKYLYAVTHINKDGYRVLSRPNQGRNHFATASDAQHMIDAMLKNNSLDTLESVYGKDGARTFEVRKIKCYDHGDMIPGQDSFL